VQCYLGSSFGSRHPVIIVISEIIVISSIGLVPVLVHITITALLA